MTHPKFTVNMSEKSKINVSGRILNPGPQTLTKKTYSFVSLLRPVTRL